LLCLYIYMHYTFAIDRIDSIYIYVCMYIFTIFTTIKYSYWLITSQLHAGHRNCQDQSSGLGFGWCRDSTCTWGPRGARGDEDTKDGYFSGGFHGFMNGGTLGLWTCVVDLSIVHGPFEPWNIMKGRIGKSKNVGIYHVKLKHANCRTK
jgi:hypothetical protein